VRAHAEAGRTALISDQAVGSQNPAGRRRRAFGRVLHITFRTGGPERSGAPARRTRRIGPNGARAMLGTRIKKATRGTKREQRQGGS